MGQAPCLLPTTAHADIWYTELQWLNILLDHKTENMYMKHIQLCFRLLRALWSSCMTVMDQIRPLKAQSQNTIFLRRTETWSRSWQYILQDQKINDWNNVLGYVSINTSNKQKNKHAWVFYPWVLRRKRNYTVCLAGVSSRPDHEDVPHSVLPALAVQGRGHRGACALGVRKPAFRSTY